MAKGLQPASPLNPYGDAVARLAGIRQALALADANGAGPANDLEARSDQLFGAAAAGLDALVAVDGNGAASRDLVERIRRELAEISNLVLKGCAAECGGRSARSPRCRCYRRRAPTGLKGNGASRAGTR